MFRPVKEVASELLAKVQKLYLFSDSEALTVIIKVILKERRNAFREGVREGKGVNET